jgi:hypothetical protein
MTLQGNPEDDIKEIAHKKPGNKWIKARAKHGTKKPKTREAKETGKKTFAGLGKKNGKLKSTKFAGPKGYGRRG